nr:metallophosphoesterase [Capsulimonas corticalis]
MGDVHGCLDALTRLTAALGYNAVGEHPEGRTLVFVGDLINRGPDTAGVLRFAIDRWRRKQAQMVMGNHDVILAKWLRGEAMEPGRTGLDETIRQIESQTDSAQFKDDIRALLADAPLYRILDGGQLIVAHAGIEEKMIGHEDDPEVQRFILYGDAIGKSPEGKTIRRDWAADYRGSAFIVYGHTPQERAEIRYNTVNVDTGAAHGGRLTALRWPEQTLVSVASNYHVAAPKDPA